MAYRNGTYIAFNANNTTDFTKSDMKYYNLLKAWHIREERDFRFVNSHEKTSTVRDSSQRETLIKTLKTRLLNSKNMILIISKITKNDTDWVPFEIRYAVDTCEIPIIATYVDYDWILKPAELSSLWPVAMSSRIKNDTAHIIHIPFKEAPLSDAVLQFDFNNYPKSSLSYYTRQTYIDWGII